MGELNTTSMLFIIDAHQFLFTLFIRDLNFLCEFCISLPAFLLRSAILEKLHHSNECPKVRIQISDRFRPTYGTIQPSQSLVHFSARTLILIPQIERDKCVILCARFKFRNERYWPFIRMYQPPGLIEYQPSCSGFYPPQSLLINN